MKLKSLAAVVALLAGTQLWGQTTPAAQSPVGTPVRVGSRTAAQAPAGQPMQSTPQSRLQDMQSTVQNMHMVLKQMRAKTLATKDPAAKSNLEMWELMVNQLDKQLVEMQVAQAAREQMDQRRAAMYKQADAHAAAAQSQAMKDMNNGVVPANVGAQTPVQPVTPAPANRTPATQNPAAPQAPAPAPQN